jgi:hypothetical protein
MKAVAKTSREFQGLVRGIALSILNYRLGLEHSYLSRLPCTRIRLLRRFLFFGWLCFISFPLTAGSIDISLDLYYDDPANDDSAGSWELVATASDRGLAGLVVRLEQVATELELKSPHGFGAEVASAGFQPTFEHGTKSFATDYGDYTELIFAQFPVAAPGPQGLLYDVGTVGGANSTWRGRCRMDRR